MSSHRLEAAVIVALAALICRSISLHIKPGQARASCSVSPTLGHFGAYRWCRPYHSATQSSKINPRGPEQGDKAPPGEIWVGNRGELCSALGFKDRVGSLRWTPCEMTWGKMILLCGWGGGDDKSAGKRRCCCVLAQPQPCFRSGSPRQPAFGQGHGSAGVKYLQPSRHPDLLLSLTPWQSAPVLVCPT